MSADTKSLTAMGFLCAVAYILMAAIRIPLMPAAPFLTYDPKDVAVIIGGFLYGSFAAFGMSIVLSTLEMVTVSNTGLIGALMNMLSTCSIACTASLIYRKKKTVTAAAIGLLAGTVVVTCMMCLWNVLVTPFYLGVSREIVVGMIVPIFIPFNLIKAVLNSIVTIFILKFLLKIKKQEGKFEIFKLKRNE
ncbi:MAG: ECF transporter S component [Oscillospiraceae bacterium]|nr:ECF transporter S component [Oscillospiraceae bacterium]